MCFELERKYSTFTKMSPKPSNFSNSPREIFAITEMSKKSRTQVLQAFLPCATYRNCKTSGWSPDGWAGNSRKKQRTASPRPPNKQPEHLPLHASMNYSRLHFQTYDKRYTERNEMKEYLKSKSNEHSETRFFCCRFKVYKSDRFKSSSVIYWLAISAPL